MSNSDTSIARRYHERTKHSYWSVRTSGHTLDWSNQPLPFKIYEDLEPIPLPGTASESELALLGVLGDEVKPEEKPEPTLAELARILYFSAGITKRRAWAGGEILFRAASCTGALYHVDLYVVCADLEGLEAGLYHFNPGDFALYPLRRGDYRTLLVEAAAGEDAVSRAAAVVISTATYWRNAWKYQARTYRHFGWDNGTILANLLAMCRALGVPARLVLGYQDDPVNQLLGLDSEREVSLSLVALGRSRADLPPARPPLEPLNLKTVPLSASEVDYPEMRRMHAGTRLQTARQVSSWRGALQVAKQAKGEGERIDLSLESVAGLSKDSPESVILRRGSSRRFAPLPVRFDQLSALLHCCSRPLEADFQGPGSGLLNHWYLIVHAVENVPSGSYYFDPQTSQIELLARGEFRNQAGHLALDQRLAADASVDVFFLADLEAVLRRYGNRGYRAVQMEAGILGGRLYLAAYAQRLGATGLTFYDDEVVDFFSPHAQGLSAIFLMALGRGRKPGFGSS